MRDVATFARGSQTLWRRTAFVVARTRRLSLRPDASSTRRLDWPTIAKAFRHFSPSMTGTRPPNSFSIGAAIAVSTRIGFYAYPCAYGIRNAQIRGMCPVDRNGRLQQRSDPHRSALAASHPTTQPVATPGCGLTGRSLSIASAASTATFFKIVAPHVSIISLWHSTCAKDVPARSAAVAKPFSSIGEGGRRQGG